MIARVLERAGGGYVRPLDPQRDLEPLADLIESAFGEELALTSSPMVRDMRQMALLGPLLWVAGAAVHLFSGYVWIEDGQLVGNISLTEDREPGTWNISNVAVLPAYRGRGIAGQLLDVALAHVRQRRGRRILLQVRADNAPALALYTHRGFTIFDTVHELDLPFHAWPVVLGISPALRRLRPSDARPLLHLILASTPPAVLRHRPSLLDAYRRGVWDRVGQWLQMAFNSRERWEWVAPWGKELVGYGLLTAKLPNGPHEVELHVRPDQRGLWELPLAEALLHTALHLPRQHVRAYISASHPEALHALHRLGFKTLRVLAQMVLELG